VSERVFAYGDERTEVIGDDVNGILDAVLRHHCCRFGSLLRLLAVEIEEGLVGFLGTYN
jgi:hypothetical protein